VLAVYLEEGLEIGWITATAEGRKEWILRSKGTITAWRGVNELRRLLFHFEQKQRPSLACGSDLAARILTWSFQGTRTEFRVGLLVDQPERDVHSEAERAIFM
jgi:hypothetical protein